MAAPASRANATNDDGAAELEEQNTPTAVIASPRAERIPASGTWLAQSSMLIEVSFEKTACADT
jgi:hypothetical protein